MRKINQIIYAMFGVGAMLFGVAALLFQGALLSDTHRSFPTTHIFREEGAAAIFIGLMSLWCIFNYERRTSVRLPDRGNSLVRLLRRTFAVDESSIQQRSAHGADNYSSPQPAKSECLTIVAGIAPLQRASSSVQTIF